MIVRVQGERWKIGSKAVSWLHSLVFTKLIANEQILLCIRERNLWFELPFILFYRLDFRKWNIKGRHLGGCCGVWSCFSFNLKHPKKRKYVTFTREEILNIGKNGSIHGNSRASQKYSVGESTVRLHRKKYEQGLTSSTKVKRGRPLLLGSEIDEKVMKYVHAIRKKGGIVNTVVGITIAQALIVKSDDKNLKVLDLEKHLGRKVYSIEWDLLSGSLQLVSLSFLMEQRKKLVSYIIIKSLSLWKNMTYHHL